MAVSDSDMTNLINNCNFVKVADDPVSGYRSFSLVLKPGSTADLNALLVPFHLDPTFTASGPVYDANLGVVWSLRCPTGRCTAINTVAKDVRSQFGS